MACRFASLFGGRTNRLTRACVLSLTAAIRELTQKASPLVLTGNAKFFSAGAELREIAALDGPSAYQFAKMGQTLMRALETVSAPVYAAISGYCMGGGLDLALACHRRIALPMLSLDTRRGLGIDYRMGRHGNACHGWWARPSLWKCLWRRKRSARCGRGHRTGRGSGG